MDEILECDNWNESLWEVFSHTRWFKHLNLKCDHKKDSYYNNFYNTFRCTVYISIFYKVDFSRESDFTLNDATFKLNRAARRYTHKWLQPVANKERQLSSEVKGYKIHRTIHFGSIPYYKRMERKRMIRVHEKSKKGGIQIKIKKEIKKLHSWKWVKKVICTELQPIKLCVWLSSVNHSNATRVCLRLLKQSERLILLNNTRFPPLVNMS